MVLSLSVRNADVAELADAQDSKSCGSDIVWVRLPPSASKLVSFDTGFFSTLLSSTYSAKKDRVNGLLHILLIAPHITFFKFQIFIIGLF